MAAEVMAATARGAVDTVVAAKAREAEGRARVAAATARVAAATVAAVKEAEAEPGVAEEEKARKSRRAIRLQREGLPPR